MFEVPMIYWVGLLVTFFACTTASLVRQHYTGEDSPQELFLAILFSLIGSIFWYVTVPIVLMSIAVWLTSRIVIKIIDRFTNE